MKPWMMVPLICLTAGVMLAGVLFRDLVVSDIGFGLGIGTVAFGVCGWVMSFLEGLDR